MPVLDKPRHEHFAQELANGVVATQAYEKAGYKSDRGNSTRLAQDDRIKQRVAEILALKAKSKGITIGSLCNELERDREHARKLDQPSTAVAATMAQAKLLGLLIERKETGQAGEFAKLTTDELRKQLEQDLAAIEAMRKAEGESSH